jgi:hypothetical protein
VKKSPVPPGMLRLRSRCIELSVSVTHQSAFRIDSNARLLLHIQRLAGTLGVSDDRHSLLVGP